MKQNTSAPGQAQEQDKREAFQTVGKCRIEDGCVYFCTPLNERLQSYADAHKGLILLEVVNLKSHSCQVAGAMYRSSRSDKGILLNYCPFCGEWIDGLRKSTPAQEVQP